VTEAVAGAVRPDESALIARLRDGDEATFEALVAEFYPSMLAVARGYVRSRAVAEEVVQEAWLGVLRGIDRFEGRCTLRTWVLRIVANVARTRAVREARSVPLSSFDVVGDEPAVDPEQFRGPDDPFPGHWRSYPTDWRRLPEERLTSIETLELVKAAIEELPEAQRLVITMRDVAGLSSEEVCQALDVTAGNQRVLLHRARARVREVLERHFDA
jgi:RNA polymerase sigma-70 factor (ECF subfamily)